MINRIMLADGSSASREVLTRRLQTAMPDMDGLDFCRNIRNNKLHRYTSVIVVSSDADQRLLHEGYNAGVTDYFDKAPGFMAFGQFQRLFLFTLVNGGVDQVEVFGCD